MTFSAPNLASRMTAEDASDLCRCIQVAFQADSVRHACAKPARVLNICGRGALSVFAARTMTGLARFFIPPTFLVCLEQAVRIAFDEIAVDFFMEPMQTAVPMYSAGLLGSLAGGAAAVVSAAGLAGAGCWPPALACEVISNVSQRAAIARLHPERPNSAMILDINVNGDKSSAGCKGFSINLSGVYSVYREFRVRPMTGLAAFAEACCICQRV